MIFNKIQLTGFNFQLCRMSDFDGSINKIDIYANLRSVFDLIYRGQDNFLAYFKPLNLKRSQTLSSKTVTPRKTSIKKWLMCLTSYLAPHVTFSIIFVSTVEFQIETYIIWRRVFFFFFGHVNFGNFTLLCDRGRLRNLQSFKTYVLGYCHAHYIFGFATSSFSLPFAKGL